MEIIRCSFDFTFKNSDFRIVVNGERPNIVHTDEYRPSRKRKNKTLTSSNKKLASEFADDINYMLTYLGDYPVISKKALLDVLIRKCINSFHFEKSLTIERLYTFIDEMTIIIVKNFLLEYSPLTDFETHQYWDSLNFNAQRVLRERGFIISPSSNEFARSMPVGHNFGLEKTHYDLAEKFIDEIVDYFNETGSVKNGQHCTMMKDGDDFSIIINKEDNFQKYLEQINGSKGTSFLKSITTMWNKDDITCEIHKVTDEFNEDDQHILSLMLIKDDRGFFTTVATKVHGLPI